MSKPKQPTDCREVKLRNGNSVKAGRTKDGLAFECLNVQGNANVVTRFSLSREAASALAALIMRYVMDETQTALALAGEPKAKKRERAR